MDAPRGNYFAALPARVPDKLWEAIKSNAPSGLRWFHPGDLHFTLAFFGKENSERLPAVREVLNQMNFAPTEITLGRLVLLPRPRRFSALSFELETGRDLIANYLAAWRNPLLEAAGCQPDSRLPFPHLTIARPARRHPEFRPGRILRWARHLEVPLTPIVIRPPVLYGLVSGSAQATISRDRLRTPR